MSNFTRGIYKGYNVFYVYWLLDLYEPPALRCLRLEGFR